MNVDKNLNIALKNDKEESQEEKDTILEYRVGDSFFAIEANYVKEILSVRPLTALPNSNPNIEGIFMLRDEVSSVVDMPRVLNKGIGEEAPYERYIVIQVDNMNIAFHVHEVSRMTRISPSDIKKPDEALKAVGKGLYKGVVHDGDRLVIVLNYDMILKGLNPEYNGGLV